MVYFSSLKVTVSYFSEYYLAQDQEGMKTSTESFGK